MPMMLVLKDLNRIADEQGISLIDDSDDFDRFTMAHLRLDEDDKCDFLLVRYAGASKETFDVWLSVETANPSKCLLEIIKTLRLESNEVVLRQLSGPLFKSAERRW